ncbi:nitrate/nitrite transport protein NarU [Klebsiella pneumoniae]|uniref:Nitrate/nitrite transport protein NarU n=1 Tax=Klebsiella pneumoniae TaxID=573 RepID=A0A2X3EGT7_KLEPN|nr:nitrate/nitrite transport protein NarU [Klebsiella pneumoniae]
MSVQNDKDNHYLLNNWRPENKAFWENKGQAIARRNLWISVACLLLAFCVWMLFSAVAVNLNKVGFHFTTDQLFLLTALPSLSGAILRVPYSFMVPLFGGRYWTVLSTVILIVPCIWLGVAIQNITTPFWVFIIIALLCGFAGANFASSMGNISFLFPQSETGQRAGSQRRPWQSGRKRDADGRPGGHLPAALHLSRRPWRHPARWFDNHPE